MTTFANHVLRFYKTLVIKDVLPKGVEVLNPYRDKIAFALCSEFYQKYYNDQNERTIIFGINPGRFGGGLTGIPFTDPVKLEKLCNIPNNLQKKVELSADFIYMMIEALGGIGKFYSDFYINSVSPLGFTAGGKNLNYYDTPSLMKSLEGFISQSIKKQIGFGIKMQIAFCLGEGENFKYLKKFNDREKLFREIIPLAHPRFIMQYKRRSIDLYVEDYRKKLSMAL
jgi:hypothetical protein